MFIVPFIHKNTTDNALQIHSISILTVGGKALWEEDKGLDVDHDILNPNDIYRKGPVFTSDKSVQFCEVDPEKTRINDFYKWTEISLNDRETFCWRSYIYLLSNKGESWLTTPKGEKLGQYEVGKLLSAILSKINT